MCVDVCKRGFLIQILAFLTVLLWNSCYPLPISKLYPYNSTYGDNRTKNEDDGGSGEIVLTTGLPYFSKDFKTLFVNNNGILSFLNELNDYNPMKFPLEENIPVIAPFWADVDTDKSGGVVWYRQTSDDAVLLQCVTQEIRNYVNEKFTATWMFIVTWDNVGFYAAVGEGKEKRNTFQCVLVTDGIQSYAIFNYEKIEWTTGANSWGNANSGLGGTAAQAGFNAGDMVNYYSIEGARTPAIINLTLTSNVGIMGKWVFRIDSAAIEDIDCDQGQITVIPRSGSMMGGKEHQISGLCFSEKWLINGRIRETEKEFPCSVINQRTVGCVLPPMLITGDVTLELNLNGQGWKYSTNFTSLNVASVKSDVIRQQSPDWVIGRSVRVTWDTQLIPSNNASLEVIGFKFINNVSILETVQSELLPSTSTGAMEFILDRKLGSYSAAILKISGKIRNIFPSIWSDVFPVRWDSEQKSKELCELWKSKDKNLTPLKDVLSSCPCTLRQASRDTGRYHSDPLCNKESSSVSNCQFHSQAVHCMQRNIKSPKDSGELCCYDNNGELLNALDRSGGGTHQRYHYRAQGDHIIPFFSYFVEDLLPYVYCCQETNLCEDYLELRPPSSCQHYHPPTPAQAAGDPHLVTLDGLEYTFNGIGDYILIEDESSTMVIHVRSVPADNSDGLTQNASVFSAIALSVRGLSDVVEIRLSEQRQEAEVLVNGLPYDTDTATSELKGVTIYKEESNTSLVSFLVVLDASGVSVSVDVTSDLLNILVMIGSDQLQGQLRGLLGNYNGNKQDDFEMKNGTILAVDSPMSQIHFQFGQSWQVIEAESLFSDTRHSDSEFQFYSPVFLDTLSEESLPDDIADLCRDNKQCIFDFLVTGKESVARSTIQFVEKFQVLKEDIKPVIRCPHLTVPENGNRTVLSYTVTSEAMFECFLGYTMVSGRSIRVCKKDGQWDEEEVVCAKAAVLEEPNILIISLATGSGFVAFIIVVILLYVCYSHWNPKKSEEHESHLELPDIFYVPSNIPKPIFENPAFLLNLQRLTEGGGFHIPRPQYLDPLVIRDYF